MSISAYKTFAAGEVLTAADLNSSFSNIINNAADLVSPFTKNIDAGSRKIVSLANGTLTGDAVNLSQLTAVDDAVDTLRADLIASSGTDEVNYISGRTGSKARPATSRLRDKDHLFDFLTAAQQTDILGTTSTGSTCGAEINAALAALGNGGELWFANGRHKCEVPILAEDMRGVMLRGTRGQYTFAGTRFFGSHTGKTILSLVGSLFSGTDGIGLEGDTANRPKTALLLGRSSLASAGNHTFNQLLIQGYYDQFGLYNIASEDNTFLNCYILPTTASVAGAYFCQGDTYAIGGLTGSSMEMQNFVGGNIGSADNTAGSTGLFIDAGESTGHFNFNGTFMLKNGGDSFVKIRLGAIDGKSTTFPIQFHGLAGEKITNAPTNGLHIQATGNYSLSGLVARNMRLQDAATNHILCDSTAGTGTLIGADISTSYVTPQTLNSTFQTVQASRLSLLGELGSTFGDISSSDVKYANAPTTVTTNGAGNRWMSLAGTSGQVTLTYSASISVDALVGDHYVIPVTNGTAFTINNPTHLARNKRIAISARNASGGAMGAITWDTLFKIAGWTNPANGFNRTVEFIYNGTNLQQVGISAVDSAN